MALAILRVVGITWGLPASDGWDNDGVAPRDFLAGAVETFVPGHYYTYPPVHVLLLSVLTLPITIVALVRAPSLSAHDVIAEVVHVPYMTANSIVARAVALAMSLAVTWAVAKMAEEATGRARAGWCAAAFTGVNVPLTYYAHTSNLDVPYLFWASLALLELMRAIARREDRRLRRVAVLAALAVATKDQAYALFVLGVPFAFGAWLALDADARDYRRARSLARGAAEALAIGAAVLLVADAAVFNPRGFVERLKFLRGPAMKPHVEYPDDWGGRLQALHDVARDFGTHYPWALVALAGLGLVLLLRAARSDRARLAAALVPLFAAISFTLAFDLVALRNDFRFVMPQTVLAAAYGGIGLDAALFAAGAGALRWAARGGAAAAMGVAIFDAIGVDAALLMDPRYDAEAWMRGHVAAGDRVETYGLNVYMPRFPPAAHVARVGPEPLAGRSPVPGIDEVVGDYDRARERGARFIVVNQAWLQTQRTTQPSASRYFGALASGQYAPYRRAYVARWDNAVWPAIDLHASTTREVWIYALDPGAP